MVILSPLGYTPPIPLHRGRVLLVRGHGARQQGDSVMPGKYRVCSLDAGHCLLCPPSTLRVVGEPENEKEARTPKTGYGPVRMFTGACLSGTSRRGYNSYHRGALVVGCGSCCGAFGGADVRRVDRGSLAERHDHRRDAWCLPGGVRTQ